MSGDILSIVDIGKGHTGHTRYGALRNHFVYPVFYLRFATEKEVQLKQLLAERFSFYLGFQPKDYLWRRAGSIDQNIRSYLLEKCKYNAEQVSLVTMPRLLGYAFNPVSFWFCRSNGLLEAVLCEVNNTFGERHFYWLDYRLGSNPNSKWLTAKKIFHVSPFLPVEGTYRFRIQESAERIRIDIQHHSEDGQKVLSTWLELNLSPLELESKVGLLWQYGWMTAMVIARIHFQAIKLFFKRARFYHKPAPPQEEVTQ